VRSEKTVKSEKSKVKSDFETVILRAAPKGSSGRISEFVPAETTFETLHEKSLEEVFRVTS